MKIVALDIEGFRSLRRISWKPGNLNVLIGPNAGGKSNVLRALEMLAASAQARLADHVQREGGMGSLVWDGRATSIGFQLAATMSPSRNATTEPDFVYDLRLERLARGSSYQIGNESLDEKHVEAPREAPKLRPVPEFHRQPILPVEPLIGALPSDLQIATLRTDQESRLSAMRLAILPVSVWSFANYVAGWRVYQDFRTDRDAPAREAPVTRREIGLEGTGENLICVLHTLYSESEQFKDDLDASMRAAFSGDFDELVFAPDADQRIQMRIRWRGLKSKRSAADLSDGTLRFLYLLAILAHPEPPGLVALDEPETGLHPGMFRIVAELAAQAADRTQVVLTTHSPAFLDVLAENVEATITVCECREGETHVTNKPPDELKYWLKHYTLGELFRSGELEDTG